MAKVVSTGICNTSQAMLYSQIHNRSKPLDISFSRSQHSCITSPALSSEANSKTDGSSSSSSDNDSVCSSEIQQLTCEEIKRQLMARWRYPTLTVHKIDVPISNPTIISHYAKAAVSMRIVPNQTIAEICDSFKQYVCQTFQKLKSDNRISVRN